MSENRDATSMGLPVIAGERSLPRISENQTQVISQKLKALEESLGQPPVKTNMP